MKVKTNIWDIYKNKGQYDIKPVLAYLMATTFGICGVLDCSVKGVEVDEGFYWACIGGIAILIASDSLRELVALRTGQASVQQQQNNFDQKVNNLEQNQNNKNNEEP